MVNINAHDPRRVLIVDDDSTLLHLFGSILEIAGYEVDTAESGVEGISKYRRDCADVIVTDRTMPNMDGEQMTEVIKTLNPRVPIILITGLTGDLRHPELYSAVLPKPFRSANLLTLIETALAAQAETAD